VVCDFGGEREALEAIAHAVDERRGLVLTHARHDREADENGVVINLANVVSVQVSTTDNAPPGPVPVTAAGVNSPASRSGNTPGPGIVASTAWVPWTRLITGVISAGCGTEFCAAGGTAIVRGAISAQCSA